jgi:hypothetical protein
MEIREITTAIVQEIGKRDARIYELELVLNAAIGHIEMLMGSDADESEDVAWLQKILNKECE